MASVSSQSSEFISETPVWVNTCKVLYNNYFTEIAPEWFGIHAAASEYSHTQRYWANSYEQRIRIRTEETQSRPSSCETTIGELFFFSWMVMKALLLKYCNWRMKNEKLEASSSSSFIRQNKMVLIAITKKNHAKFCVKSFQSELNIQEYIFDTNQASRLDEYHSTFARSSTMCCNPLFPINMNSLLICNDLCFSYCQSEANNNQR